MHTKNQKYQEFADTQLLLDENVSENKKENYSKADCIPINNEVSKIKKIFANKKDDEPEKKQGQTSFLGLASIFYQIKNSAANGINNLFFYKNAYKRLNFCSDEHRAKLNSSSLTNLKSQNFEEVYDLDRSDDFNPQKLACPSNLESQSVEQIFEPRFSFR